MPSPKKSSGNEILGNRKSSPRNHRVNKNQLHAMSTTSNNGFIRRNSSSLANVFDALSESRDSGGEEIDSNLDNSFLLDVPCDFALKRECSNSLNKFQENICDDTNTSSPAVLGNINNPPYLLPLEIVVLDNRVFEKNSKEDGERDNSSGKESSFQNSEFLNLQDVRIRENPITKLAVASSETFGSDGSKYHFPSNSTRKPASSEKPKRFWMGSRKKFLKYLMSTTGIIILSLSIVHLTFFNKTECLGE